MLVLELLLAWFTLPSSPAYGVAPTSHAVTTSEARYRAQLETELRAQLPGADRIDVPELKLPAGTPPEGRLRVLTPLTASGLVSYEIAADHGAHARGVAGVRVFGPVVMASRNLRGGERVDESNAVVQQVDLARLPPGGYFRRLDELRELRLRGPIAWASVIRIDATEAVPLVSPGQYVELTKEKGSLRLTLRVRALEGGAASKWIRVENLTSRKIFLAKVVRSGEVTL